MGYISQKALAGLSTYAYKGVDKSVLSRYVLNPFWNWFVTLWPIWVAPNTITLLGLGMVGINFLTMVYYDPQFLTEKGGAIGPPHWVYYTWAAGLFIYQSFDAIDGKQARRTGMAGPLGEMFDHGCDAINTTLEVILTSYALNIGHSWWMVASQVATLANFYLTTWEEYHTGQLYLGVFSGPVEGILMIVAIFTLSGMYAMWDTGILTVLHLEHIDIISHNVRNVGLNEAFMIFGALALAFNIISSYTNVYKSCCRNNRSVLRPLLSLLPFPITVLLQVLWLTAPGSRIIHTPLFVPFICAWGLQFAHQVGRMILAHVTGSTFPYWNWIWVWFALGAADANAQRLFGVDPVFQGSYIGTKIFVYLTLIVTFFFYERFVTLVITEITNYLGIACFTVRKKDVDGQWKEASQVNKMKGT
ncbi:Choline/ethanolaminephosphotransferase [Hysterangium stoloniferum]|nr:Choline/ethanolaminephosphotransferase [Hysterangium stoloniferum]